MKPLKRPLSAKWVRFLSTVHPHTLTVVGLAINVLLLFVTTALALGAFLQWVAVRNTLVEIQKQTPAVLQSGKAALTSAKTAQAALEVSQRPWLVITGTKIPSVGVNSLAFMSYDLDLQVDNTGLTPATNTALLTDMFLGSPHVSLSIPEEMAKTCHKLDKVGPLSGIMVPPQKKQFALSRQPNFVTSYTPLRSALKTAHIDPQTGNRQVSATLVTCVLYRSPISNDVHHTAQIFDVIMIFSESEASRIQSGRMAANEPILLRYSRISLFKNPVINDLVD